MEDVSSIIKEGETKDEGLTTVAALMRGEMNNKGWQCPALDLVAFAVDHDEVLRGKIGAQEPWRFRNRGRKDTRVDSEHPGELVAVPTRRLANQCRRPSCSSTRKDQYLAFMARRARFASLTGLVTLSPPKRINAPRASTSAELVIVRRRWVGRRR